MLILKEQWRLQNRSYLAWCFGVILKNTLIQKKELKTQKEVQDFHVCFWLRKC